MQYDFQVTCDSCIFFLSKFANLTALGASRNIRPSGPALNQFPPKPLSFLWV